MIATKIESHVGKLSDQNGDVFAFNLHVQQINLISRLYTKEFYENVFYGLVLFDLFFFSSFNKLATSKVSPQNSNKNDLKLILWLNLLASNMRLNLTLVSYKKCA